MGETFSRKKIKPRTLVLDTRLLVLIAIYSRNKNVVVTGDGEDDAHSCY
jgi:hypothetical protein